MVSMDSDKPLSIPEALMELTENLSPLVEASKGFRNQLIAQGWTEEQAQATAALVLNGLVASAFGLTNSSSDESE